MLGVLCRLFVTGRIVLCVDRRAVVVLPGGEVRSAPQPGGPDPVGLGDVGGCGAQLCTHKTTHLQGEPLAMHPKALTLP